MAKNPMQKKARNSFILGMLITFIIMAMVVALLLVKIKNMKEIENERLANIISVCVLNQDVKSGQIITSNMIEKKEINKDVVPTNGTSNFTKLENYFLEDKSGNRVITKDKKTYLERDGRELELKIEEKTGFYYIEFKEGNDIRKEYIELATPPLIAKIDMKLNTVITSEMIVKSDEKTTDDLRTQEYNMLQLASQISADDYIDIRFRLPSGEDYIVVSKKKVEIPQIDGIDSVNSIWLKLTEDEILTMSNAIVENYIIEGSLLYTAKYVEPGTQERAIPTYVPSKEVQELMRNNDENIVETAKINLINRYNENQAVRNTINNTKATVEYEEARKQVTKGVLKEVEKAKAAREDYLEALAGNQ